MTTLTRIQSTAPANDNTAAVLQVVFVIAAFVTIALASAIVQQLIPGGVV